MVSDRAMLANFPRLSLVRICDPGTWRGEAEPLVRLRAAYKSSDNLTRANVAWPTLRCGRVLRMPDLRSAQVLWSATVRPTRQTS